MDLGRPGSGVCWLPVMFSRAKASIQLWTTSESWHRFWNADKMIISKEMTKEGLNLSTRKNTILYSPSHPSMAQKQNPKGGRLYTWEQTWSTRNRSQVESLAHQCLRFLYFLLHMVSIANHSNRENNGNYRLETNPNTRSWGAMGKGFKLRWSRPPLYLSMPWIILARILTVVYM